MNKKTKSILLFLLLASIVVFEASAMESPKAKTSLYTKFYIGGLVAATAAALYAITNFIFSRDNKKMSHAAEPTTTKQISGTVK